MCVCVSVYLYVVLETKLSHVFTSQGHIPDILNYRHIPHMLNYLHISHILNYLHISHIMHWEHSDAHSVRVLRERERERERGREREL